MKNDQQKNILVSNRLPLSVSKVKGKLVFKKSDGGLISAMRDFRKDGQSIWIGWPGIASDEITNTEKAEIINKLRAENCIPVFLNQTEIDSFYGGYCNETLWPLFHYFVQRTKHDHESWEAYKAVNAKFAIAAKSYLKKDTIVWIHDYHLLLLPKMLRTQKKDALIGFFLHTPFPSHEIFRLLPERSEILEGLSGANLVGFHTYDYVRHYLSANLRVLGYENYLGAMKIGKRLVRADVFPIGIDYELFANTQPRIEEKQKMILSVDRVDYTKGIPERLTAFELFLEQNPEQIGNVTLRLIAIPSRENIVAYADLLAEIEQKVAHINGKYSTVDWSPIHYIHNQISLKELKKLYVQADVMLVTPLRDGMNLVAKEFVAANAKSGQGVLVLSEMAGAASELQGAVSVNPFDSEEVVNAIGLALTMPLKEQKTRLVTMQKRLSTYTNSRWASDFIKQLQMTKPTPRKNSVYLKKNKTSLINALNSAKRRLILFDYDGTLAHFHKNPESETLRPTKEIVNSLEKLSENKKTDVYIISGRSREQLSEWFLDSPLHFIAEHGAWTKHRGGKWQKNKKLTNEWKEDLLPVFEQYADRTPGSHVEEKDFSLVWHYRAVNPELSYIRTREMKAELRQILQNTEVSLKQGNKILEVTPNEVNKGSIVTQIITKHNYDYIFAIGDDKTDEDMFEVLKQHPATTVKVGLDPSEADLYLPSTEDSIALLHELAAKII